MKILYLNFYIEIIILELLYQNRILRLWARPGLGPARAVKGRATFLVGDDFFEKALWKNIILSKGQGFHQKVVQDKPELIGNGLTSSGPVDLYRAYPG